VAVAVVILLAVEGFSSLVVVGRLGAGLLRPLTERLDTQPDPELGWVSVPDLDQPDRYGPGIGLMTNAQGFRHAGDVATQVPAGKARLICTGGGFTFGPGVANSDTWCDVIGRVDPRLEAVNIGQAGYGADQAFLLFKRDAAPLDQDVHIFAFVADEFERMRSRAVQSYGKPTLALAGGALAVEHVPVPFRSSLAFRLDGVVQLFSDTRTAEMIRGLVGAGDDRAQKASRIDPLQPVVARMFTELDALHASRGGTAVLAFLPVRQDYDDRVSEGWRSFVHEAARDRLPLIDLVADLRAVPPAEVDSLFYEGHYSAAGHEFIARALYRRLMALPRVRSRVNAPDRLERN
jgi:hypothetical protein